MEYELFSASKLPVSYKAAVMKRVNEIKRMTEWRELHAPLIPQTLDRHVDDTVEHISASHVSVSSVESRSSFSNASPVDVTADSGAVNMVSYTYCDKANIAVTSTACASMPSKESVDNCDIVKADDIRVVCGSVESFMSETMASIDSVEDGDCSKDDLRSRCKTTSHVSNSHHSSQISVKSECKLAVDAANKPTTAAVKKVKSVRISESPPTVSYIKCQHKAVCNGASNNIIKVSRLLCLIYMHVAVVLLIIIII